MFYILLRLLLIRFKNLRFKVRVSTKSKIIRIEPSDWLVLVG